MSEAAEPVDDSDLRELLLKGGWDMSVESGKVILVRTRGSTESIRVEIKAHFIPNAAASPPAEEGNEDEDSDENDVELLPGVL